MKTPTAEEKRHLGRVAGLGCIAKRCDAPAEVHHIRAGAGMGRKNSHFDTIPLCPRHHRTGGYGIAFHAGPKAWQAIFGFERELLERVKHLLNEPEWTLSDAVKPR